MLESRGWWARDQRLANYRNCFWNIMWAASHSPPVTPLPLPTHLSPPQQFVSRLEFNRRLTLSSSPHFWLFSGPQLYFPPTWHAVNSGRREGDYHSVVRVFFSFFSPLRSSSVAHWGTGEMSLSAAPEHFSQWWYTHVKGLIWISKSLISVSFIKLWHLQQPALVLWFLHLSPKSIFTGKIVCRQQKSILICDNRPEKAGDT